jgi:TrmH family RNA methyltransferase
MANFGFNQLMLVAPEASPNDADARKLSAQGEPILHRARIVSDLAEAAGDCLQIAGTSARTGGLFRRQSAGPPDIVIPRLVEASGSGPVAIVFGPERDGLSNAELTRCHWLIHIPTSPAYPALNLAQAVCICLYEFHRTRLPTRSGTGEQLPAHFAQQEEMFNHLERALRDIGFLFGNKEAALMHALRHLIGRAQPTPMEVDLLHGLARQLEWYVGERGQ